MQFVATDKLDGGAGTDRAQYNASSEGLIADLQVARLNTGDAAGDTYISIENLYGSNHNDNLRGDAQNNAIWGANGNDVIYGRGGNDHINGGAGNDNLRGQSGNDTLIGGDGADRFVFWENDGNDRIGDFADGSDKIQFIRTGNSFSDLDISNVSGNAVIDYGSGSLTLTGVDASLLDTDDFIFS